jgi:hypothetical protein
VRLELATRAGATGPLLSRGEDFGRDEMALVGWIY